MSTDAIMSTSRDSAEERDVEEMMSIDPKPSTVSITSVTKLTVDTASEVAESRDDNGAVPEREATGQKDERQGTAPVPTPPAATSTATSSSTKKKGPPKKRTPKGRPQARTQGNYQNQRGPVPYHTYGVPPHSYSYGGPAGPSLHDLYGHPQYHMPPMPGYGAHGGPFGHPSFGAGPYSHPPPHMFPYQGAPMQQQSLHQQPLPTSAFTSSSEDTASLGSSKSKSSKSGKSSTSRKKRTIDGVDQTMNVNAPPQGLSSAFTMRRVHSNASTSSTITTGHNTSTETPNLTEDSPQKQRSHLPPLSSRPDYHGPISMHHDSHKQSYHRRDWSGASTTSSLSVGGLSLSSYETRGSKEGAPMVRNSPKRRRQDEAVTRKEQDEKSSDKVDDKEHKENLFLSLSTSPINSDVEATPVSRNTAKPVAKKSTATKDKGAAQELQTAPSMESIRNSDTPTPPVPSGAADSDMITDEHLLNRHLRGQTFTPLPHIGQYTENREGNPSPPGISANPSFGSTIGTGLSWDIAGDAPSLGEMGDWDEHHQHHRPGSAASLVTGGAFAQWKEGDLVPSSHFSMNIADAKSYDPALRLTVLSPHSDEEMEENARASVPGGTTPIAFYENHERLNGQLKDGHALKPIAPMSAGQTQFGDAGHIHQLFLTNGGRGSDSKKTPMSWTGSSGYMRYPPAPLYTSSEKSPMNGERNFFSNAMLSLHQQSGANDRIRNLRGRAPDGGQRMPMTHQLPAHVTTSFSHSLTSPMGSVPSAKGQSWSPHAIHSPHPVPQPDPNTKRKCLPMKPPIPTKFQGDMEKYRCAPLPDFANIVNFPAAMAQSKQMHPSQLPDGMRTCVMCGMVCPSSLGGKHNKKAKPMDNSLAARNTNNAQTNSNDSQFGIIPTQNKGLCTLCDVNVWIIASTGLEIKWCKGCKNFRTWAAFGDKGLATKCLRCRDRQREKYAIQKEEKERIKALRKATKQQASKSH